MKKKSIYLICLILFLGTILVGCYRSVPPDISDIQELLDRDFNAIQTVVAFMKNSTYTNIYITDTNGVMTADLSNEPISDPNVISAVNLLLERSHYYKICKTGNTIYLLQWKGLQDIGCGIAYTINGIDVPEIAFATKILPLSIDGWFYYVSDYEEWRNNQN